MKNKLFLGLSFFLMGSVLAGCGCGGGIDAKTVEQVRDFAAAMKKGVDDFNGLIYESSFQEKYQVDYESENETEKTNYSLSYHAEGDVQSGYALNIDGDTKATPALIYSEGSGYFAGRQQEVAKLSHVVTNKANGQKSKNTQADYALKHQFGIQFGGEDLCAYGKSEVANNLVPSNSASGEFRGKIARSALGELSADIFEATISRVLYLEAWSTISLFKGATVKYFQGLDLSTDDKVKQFVSDKQIKITENETGIQVNFALDGGKILQGMIGKDTGVSASVPATARIDRQSKLVAFSDYNFKDLFLALLQKGNVNMNSYQVSVDSFSLRTVLTADSANQKKLEGTFPVYAEDQKTEFVTKFSECVIPSLEHVEIEG